MATREIQALVHDPEIRPLFFDKRRVTKADGSETDVEVQRNYLRSWQREEKEREIGEIQRVLDDPIARKSITNPGKVVHRIAAQKRDLTSQTPPVLSAAQRDKVAKLETACREQFTQNMPTDEQMRRKPPGAQDHHTAWDRANKTAVLLWKAARLMLHPRSPERDLCNVERYRPNVPTRNMDVNAQLPGVFALSDEAKANYDQIDWREGDAAKAVNAQIQKMIDEGQLTVKTGVKRGLRVQKNGPVFEDAESGKIFSGPFAQANYKRHMARKEKGRIAREEGAPQEVTA